MYSHEAHILREHLNEWCGGTEPPTMVTVDSSKQGVRVDIYEAGSNIEVGEILTPVDSEQFSLAPDVTIDRVSIGNFAGKALGARGL